MKKLFSILVFIVGLGVYGQAQAVTYYFNQSNTFGAWTGSIPAGYGSIDISKGMNDWVFFEVRANTDYFQPANNLTWDKFYFNYNGTLDTSKFATAEVGRWSVDINKNVSTFGRFDFGNEGTRIRNNSVNPLNFTIKIAGLNLDDFYVANSDGWYFAGHLRGFDNMNGVTSTFLASGGNPPPPVPEPGTLLLLGSGLAGVAWYVRKRKQA